MFECALHPVEHSNALFITGSIGFVGLPGFVPFEVCHEKVVDRFGRFAAAPIYAFDFVADMPVVVFFSKLYDSMSYPPFSES